MLIALAIVIIVGVKAIIALIRRVIAALYVLSTKLGVCIVKAEDEYHNSKGIFTSVVNCITGFTMEFWGQVETYYVAGICLRDDIDINAAMVELRNSKSRINRKFKESKLW